MSTTLDSSGIFHSHYTVLDDKEFQVKGRTLFFVVILFTVVLLVTVFLLYARWVCRYRPSNSPSSSHASDAPPQKPRGLDAALIRGLPIVLYQSSSGSELVAAGCGECSICLGVFEDGEKVKVLPQCRHCYHSDCVDTWLSSQSSCPLCRTSLWPNSNDALQIVVQ